MTVVLANNYLFSYKSLPQNVWKISKKNTHLNLQSLLFMKTSSICSIKAPIRSSNNIQEIKNNIINVWKDFVVERQSRKTNRFRKLNFFGKIVFIFQYLFNFFLQINYRNSTKIGGLDELLKKAILSVLFQGISLNLRWCFFPYWFGTSVWIWFTPGNTKIKLTVCDVGPFEHYYYAGAKADLEVQLMQHCDGVLIHYWNVFIVTINISP